MCRKEGLCTPASGGSSGVGKRGLCTPANVAHSIFNSMTHTLPLTLYTPSPYYPYNSWMPHLHTFTNTPHTHLTLHTHTENTLTFTPTHLTHHVYTPSHTGGDDARVHILCCPQLLQSPSGSCGALLFNEVCAVSVVRICHIHTYICCLCY